MRFLWSNATYVGGLAAAVLVAVGIYWMWPSRPPEPGRPQYVQDPFLQKIVARNTALARADTPAKRLGVLGEAVPSKFSHELAVVDDRLLHVDRTGANEVG